MHIIESNHYNFGIVELNLGQTVATGIDIEHQPGVAEMKYYQKLLELIDNNQTIVLPYFPPELDQGVLRGTSIGARFANRILKEDGSYDFYMKIADYCATKNKKILCPDYHTGKDFYVMYGLTRVVNMPWGLLSGIEEWRSSGYYHRGVEPVKELFLYKWMPDVEDMRNALTARAMLMYQMDNKSDNMLYVASGDHVRHVFDYARDIYYDQGGFHARKAVAYSRLSIAPVPRLYMYADGKWEPNSI